MKNFLPIVSTLEAKETYLKDEGPTTLPAGKLSEFIERAILFKEMTGMVGSRCEEGLEVLRTAGYRLCEVCGEMHKVGEACPFESLVKKKTSKEAKEDDNTWDLTSTKV